MLLFVQSKVRILLVRKVDGCTQEFETLRRNATIVVVRPVLNIKFTVSVTAYYNNLMDRMEEIYVKDIKYCNGKKRRTSKSSYFDFVTLFC